MESENERINNIGLNEDITVREWLQENQQLKDRIAELESENAKLNIELDKRDCIDYPCRLIEKEQLKQFTERLKEMPFNIEFTFKESSYEDIKKLANLMKEYSVKYIDETLKEFIDD